MHTPAWQALRLAACKPKHGVCRFLVGRRFPTFKRSFHIAPARRRQDEPTEPPELPEAAQNHIVDQLLSPQPAGAQEVEAEEVTETFNGTPPNLPSSKDPSPYGSASRRAFRNVKRPPTAPPQLPSWFIDGNVTLSEENGVNPADLHRGGSLEKLDQKLKIRIQNVRGEGEGQAPDSADSMDPHREAEKGALYSVDASVYLEVQDMISAGLNIPRDPDNASSARPHLVLHCPQEGGVFFLDYLVKHFALVSNADIVRVDAQDIAEIGGRYIRDFKDMRGNTLSALGYETYMTPPSREAQEEDEAADDEAEDAEYDDDRRRPKSTAFQKTNMSIVPVHISGGSIADMMKSLGALGGPSTMPGKPPGQLVMPQSQNIEANRDAKASLLIEALLSATEAKRKTQPMPLDTSEMVGDDKADGELSVSAPSISDPADIATSTPKTTDESTAVYQEASTPRPFSTSSQKLIVHVRDYHEINSTQNGSRILERLHEVVQRKRGEGQRIIIIGSTTAGELLPSLSKSGLRHVQSDQSNNFTRTIVTPSTAPSVETQFMEEAKIRIEDINIRHIRDMLRRISPDPFQTNALLSEPKLKLESHHVFSSGLDESVWSMDRVHRVATLALGRLEENEEMKVDDIEGALGLIDISDTSKVEFLEKEAAIEKQRSNPLHRDPSSPTINNDERMRKLRKTCNTHEKKLLHGVIDPSAIRTTFTDVRAPPETIEALKTLTSLSLVRPDAFTYGVLATDRIPGLLLYGPPGTGKTLLAKAVAKESGATVLEVSGSDVYDMYVGEGEKNIRAIFTLAKKLTPCIVFIDEADAILGSRGGSSNRTTHRELINQFLREWDGMTEMSAFIMVATNRPFDLDEASLRRLPRRLLVDLPTEEDREAILGIHLKDEKLAEDVSLPTLASQTPFYSGSDLKNLAVAAALACVREEFDAAAAAAKSVSASSSSSSPNALPTSDTSSTTSSTTSLTSSTSDSTSTSPSTSSSDTTSEKAPEPYTYPAKRTLELRHFTRALEEISASISEDMGSLSAIRKFDEKYGDRRGRRKKLGGYGFETVKEGEKGDGSARVRK